MKTENEPLRLDDYIFTTADICRVSGEIEKNLRNWIARGTIEFDGPRFAGRLTYSLADCIRLAAVHDLTSRAQVPAIEAAKLATVLLRELRKWLPGGVADPEKLPRTLALTLATIDGEPHVGLIDPEKPGYFDWAGEWGRAHIVLPIGALAARVLWDVVTVLAERRAA